jgi:mRNA interferase HicA
LKQRDLIKRFEDKGWWFLRSGGRHDLYTDGKNIEQIPRHREVNERLAKDLIKKWGL